MSSNQEPDASVAKPKTKADAKGKRKGGRRLWMRIGLWMLGGFIGLLLLIVILVPIILSDARVKGMIEEAGAEALNGRTVTVGSVELEYFSGIKLTDVRVGGREGFSDDLVHIKEVDIRVEVWTAALSFGYELHAAVSVVDPEILIERNAAGELSIQDLLDVKAKKDKDDDDKEPSELLELDMLSLSLEVAGGRAVLRDKSGVVERTTTLQGLSVEAGMEAIDQPLVYKATATVGDGRFDVSGKPRLFHDGVADPAQVSGELLTATISKFPADAVIAFFGLPPVVTSVDGELLIAADQPGQVAATGKIAATSPHEGMSFGASLSATADIKKLDAVAEIAFNAEPFAQGSLKLDVSGAGTKQLNAVGTLDGDLAKLTSGKVAKSLGMPMTADGASATSQGRVTGRVEITGPLPEITCVATGAIKGFQAHPSLTGDKTLPPEDGDFRAKAILHLTADNKPDRLDIPTLEAKASFLDARISNGRLESLADLKKLDADLAGHVRFSGDAFSSRFGKALALPALTDKLAIDFSVKGAGGRAKIAADAKIEREQGTPDPVEFTFSAQLDASGEKVALRNIKARAKAGGAAAPYARGTLTGTASDLAGTPNADVTFDGSIDLRRLVDRLARYAKGVADLKPSGQIEFAGAVDTGAGRAELRTLKVATPYLALGLKVPGEVTGIDIAKFREDPVAASKLLAGNVVMEGTLLLDALRQVPWVVVPAELEVGGAMPFSLKVGKASPMRIELVADATSAAITYGDLIAKHRGSEAKLALVAVLSEGVAVDIPTLEAAIGGAQMKLVGSVSEDRKTFTCKSLTAVVDDPAGLIAMVPKLKDVKLSGRSDVSLSGKVAIEQVAAGDLSGIEFTGTADLREMHAGHTSMPKLAVTASGPVKLGANAIDAGGLTVIASTLPDKRKTTLTFKELRITSANDGAKLLADPDALAVSFFAESPEILASDLLKALPQTETAGAEAEAPATSEKPEQPKEGDGAFAFLKKHKVTGRLAVAKLIYDEHVVSNIATEFQLRDNRLTMQKPLTAVVHQGTVEADVTADLNDPLIAHSGKVSVRKVDVDSAVSAISSFKEVFEGKTGAKLTWKGRGYSLDDIRRSWTAGREVVIEDGVIADFSGAPRVIADIAGYIIKYLGGEAFPDDKFSVGELKVKMALSEGKVTSEDFVVGGKNGFNFMVSGAQGDLAGNFRATVTVVVPVEFAISYLSKEFSPMKQSSVAAVVREKLTKSNPSFCSFEITQQDGKYRAVPKILIVGWASNILKDVLTDPGSILKGILRDKLEKKREEEDAPDVPGAEGDELKNGDKGEDGIEGVEPGKGPMTEEERKREKKRKKKAEKARKKREREEAIRKGLEGFFK